MGKGWKVVGGLGLVLVAVGFWSKSVVVIVLGIVLTLVGERQGARAAKETHEQLEGAAILPALKGVFDSAALQTNERLTRQDIDAMQLLLHQDFHYVDGCDKVTAKYRGVEVLLGNVRLMQTDTYREEETGMERSTEKEVWQGLMLTCKVGHAFPVGLAITPRGKVDGLLRYADVKTGNEAFDKRFTVKTDNAEAALLTLTPRMQEKILAAANASPGAFFVTFCCNGRVSMAVRTGRNFFVPEKHTNDTQAVRKNLQENLRRMLDIIDETNPIAPATAQEEEV